jgi:hypothetical protein
MHPVLQAILITVIAALAVAVIIYIASKINDTASKKDIENTLIESKKYTNDAIISHERSHTDINARFAEMKEVNEKTYNMVFYLYQKELDKK